MPAPRILIVPDAAPKEAGSAQFDFVLLFLQHFFLVVSIFAVGWQVAEDFQNGVADGEGSHVDVFQADILWAVALILIAELAGICHLLACLAILLKCNDPNIDLILH